jgi:hypothetical protein
MTMTEQLSLDVLPDPRLVPGGLLIGKLRISGEFGVERDLNRGEQIIVQISDADGQVITTALGMVSGVGFANIMDKEAVIGTERQHRAKLA